MNHAPFKKILPSTALVSILPASLLVGLRLVFDAPISIIVGLEDWCFSICALLGAGFCTIQLAASPKKLDYSRGLVLLGWLVLSGSIYIWGKSTPAAWLFLAGTYTLLLVSLHFLRDGCCLWQILLLESAFIAIAGTLPVFIEQIETRFSTEELMVALEGVAFAIYWLGLRIAFYWLPKRSKATPSHNKAMPKKLLGILLFGSTALFWGYSIFAYQESFYPLKAPSFEGISAKEPFQCAEAEPSSSFYNSESILKQWLYQMASQEQKTAAELGMLALGSNQEKWAQEFRTALLAEAQAGAFTEPAGSVKYGQYLASKRVYYYSKVRNQFPELFTAEEEEIIQKWFSAINQRAFTIEWVDFLYGLAFANPPEGPYENQENGAGLLALLEENGLSDPNLTDRNQKYLDENPRGWLERFRVTDDAGMYQTEWIENAWYQSLYTGQVNEENLKRSFEWLKLLAPPEGRPLQYNHLGKIDYLQIASLAAQLTSDPTYIWLAGRALENALLTGESIYAQPGAEAAIPSNGTSPTSGSCLLYGGSGLPTQVGPLGPDKIVLRGGWATDDLYLLLNLRFTGWHRYKATNSLMQLYQDGPIVIENLSGETPKWFPSGRSIFRDKRIPRENLNGLIVEKSGMSAVLYHLTGLGGPWAQDPPFYAQIDHFETSSQNDISSTRITDWHGWQHTRTIYFNPEGIVVIGDHAQGPKGQAVGISWHLVGDEPTPGKRITLRKGNETDSPVEVVLLPITESELAFQFVSPFEERSVLRAQYNALEKDGHLETITVFLMKSWAGAQVEVLDEQLRVTQKEQEIILDLKEVVLQELP